MAVDVSPTFVLVWSGVVGAFVGSFLNVAIHRYGIEGETVSKPRRSRCPECRTTLTWKENIPLLSWAFQRGRCRSCSWPIPWRYPLIELATALLFLIVAWSTPHGEWGLLLVRAVVVSALLVATMVDFDHYEIPDGVSIGGMFFGPLVSLLVPALHAGSPLALRLSRLGPGEVDRFGALSNSLAGLAAGGGVLWLIGVVGAKVFRKEAMGFGDVKLLAAGGSLIGPGGALVALVLASLVGSIVGVLGIARFFLMSVRRSRRRGRKTNWGRSFAVAHCLGSMLPFGPHLALGIGIALLDWKDVSSALHTIWPT